MGTSSHHISLKFSLDVIELCLSQTVGDPAEYQALCSTSKDDAFTHFKLTATKNHKHIHFHFSEAISSLQSQSIPKLSHRLSVSSISPLETDCKTTVNECILPGIDLNDSEKKCSSTALGCVSKLQTIDKIEDPTKASICLDEKKKFKAIKKRCVNSSLLGDSGSRIDGGKRKSNRLEKREAQGKLVKLWAPHLPQGKIKKDKSHESHVFSIPDDSGSKDSTLKNRSRKTVKFKGVDLVEEKTCEKSQVDHNHEVVTCVDNIKNETIDHHDENIHTCEKTKLKPVPEEKFKYWVEITGPEGELKRVLFETENEVVLVKEQSDIIFGEVQDKKIQNKKYPTTKIPESGEGNSIEIGSYSDFASVDKSSSLQDNFKLLERRGLNRKIGKVTASICGKIKICVYCSAEFQSIRELSEHFQQFHCNKNIKPSENIPLSSVPVRLAGSNLISRDIPSKCTSSDDFSNVLNKNDATSFPPDVSEENVEDGDLPKNDVMECVKTDINPDFENSSQMETGCPLQEDSKLIDEDTDFPSSAQCNLNPEDMKTELDMSPTENSEESLYRSTTDYVGTDLAPCQHCQRVMRVGSLYLHMRYRCKNNPERVKLLTCKVCGYATPFSARLQQHNKTHTADSDGKHYVCSQCGARYKSKSGLTAHERFKHQIIVKHPLRTYACLQCRKNFNTKFCLTRHMDTHEDERGFQCDVCAKTFTDASTLSVHHRTIHLGNYRYRCEKCGHGVEKKSYLTKHNCGSQHRKSTSLSLNLQQETQTTNPKSLNQSRPMEIIPSRKRRKNSKTKTEGRDSVKAVNDVHVHESGQKNDLDLVMPNVIVTRVEEEMSMGEIVLGESPQYQDLATKYQTDSLNSEHLASTLQDNNQVVYMIQDPSSGETTFITNQELHSDSIVIIQDFSGEHIQMVSPDAVEAASNSEDGHQTKILNMDGISPQS